MAFPGPNSSESSESDEPRTRMSHPGIGILPAFRQMTASQSSTSSSGPEDEWSEWDPRASAATFPPPRRDDQGPSPESYLMRPTGWHCVSAPLAPSSSVSSRSTPCWKPLHHGQYAQPICPHSHEPNSALRSARCTSADEDEAVVARDGAGYDTKDANDLVRAQKRKLEDGNGPTRRRKIRGTVRLPMEQESRVIARFQDASGAAQGIIEVHGAAQNQRKRVNRAGRLIKAPKRPSCDYCKRIKQACESNISPFMCDRCMTTGKGPLRHLGCWNPGIINAVLFRSGPPDQQSDHPLRFANHLDRVWGVSELAVRRAYRQIELTQDAGTTLWVEVAKFEPGPGDRTAYNWTTQNGDLGELDMPPYCISNMPDARNKLLGYVQPSMRQYLNQHVDSSDSIMSATYDMALLLGRDSLLIRATLLLWSSTRLIEETWRICGEDTLGMEPCESRAPWAGIIPVTPMMDQQLDQLVIQEILEPLKDWVLERLNFKFQEAAKGRTMEGWLEIFLVSFILLHNCSVQLDAEHRFAKRYGMLGRYGPPGEYDDAQNQFDTARIVLAYFHHVLNGATLFSASTVGWEHAGLNRKQLEYLQSLKEWISLRKLQFVQMRDADEYEHGLYFVHQMFFEEFKGEQRRRSIHEMDSELESTAFAR